MMLFPLLVLLSVLAVAFASKKDGKMGKSRTFVYPGQAGGLANQFLELKEIFVQAQKMHRELIVVQSKDETSGASSFNLCDVFEMPDKVSCTKNMKMKCDDKPVKGKGKGGEPENQNKKKVIFQCDALPAVDSNDKISTKVELMAKYFDLNLLPERNEEVEYIQSVLGYNIAGQPAPAVADYTVLYWGQAREYLSKSLGTQCSASTGTENVHCLALKQAIAALVETSKAHCASSSSSIASFLTPSSAESAKKSANVCYIAGATAATAQEAGLLLDMGLMSFRGAWLQHTGRDAKTGLYDESALVPINSVSVEVMEWGVMVGAKKFVALTSEALSAVTNNGASKAAGDVLLATSLVEHERARAGKTFCTAHREGVNALTTSTSGTAVMDPTWCGRLKESNYVYAAAAAGENDDGPFENPTLNKFVINLALSLLNVFSSRFLQLALGGMCVVFLFAVSRLCYTRWYRANNKTF